MKKRVLIISDTHCGSYPGLTPPAWQVRRPTKSTTKRGKWVKLQRELWAAFEELIDKHGPYDYGLDLGDMIDGKGKKSGGTELITSDLEEQCDMAVAVRDRVRLSAKRKFKWAGVYGTGYHTSPDGEDWENIVADRAGYEKIGSHEWVEINGCIFDIKHFVGASSIPHGRHTGVAKEKLWNTLWSEKGQAPKSNIILRGHVHYHAFAGGAGWLAMTAPALQGLGTKFGSRICSGTVDWGITVVDVNDDGSFDWHVETVQINAQKAKVLKL